MHAFAAGGTECTTLPPWSYKNSLQGTHEATRRVASTDVEVLSEQLANSAKTALASAGRAQGRARAPTEPRMAIPAPNPAYSHPAV
ncbi:hypothetical protein [Desulfitobacterium sp.]|uniref:hypothetical protein n=1 Tax=Desulfitobacterium sp. TaxID=49981 RepID=UPI002B1F84D0|nr:hypothetical protein [Desulfitobacterium sp.]MEA4901466.1 hypothetical protein [Desulfitobacterium sp.]